MLVFYWFMLWSEQLIRLVFLLEIKLRSSMRSKAEVCNADYFLILEKILNKCSLGAGAIVQLCPGVTISVSAPITPTAINQELSTQGYPTDSTRATILSTGTVVSAILGINLRFSKCLT